MKKLTLGLLLFISANAVAQIKSHYAFTYYADTCWVIALQSDKPIKARDCQLLITLIDKNGDATIMVAVPRDIIMQPRIDSLYEGWVYCIPQNDIYKNYKDKLGKTWITLQIPGEEHRPRVQIFDKKSNKESKLFYKELARNTQSI